MVARWAPGGEWAGPKARQKTPEKKHRGFIFSSGTERGWRYAPRGRSDGSARADIDGRVASPAVDGGRRAQKEERVAYLALFLGFLEPAGDLGANASCV